WSVRGNEGAARRLLHRRGTRFERGDPDRSENTRRPLRLRRDPPGRRRSAHARDPRPEVKHRHPESRHPERKENFMYVEPYLFFDGRCEEALAFYREAVGAETTFLLRFKDSPEPHEEGCVQPGMADKVMHAAFKIGDTVIMASDGRCEGK